MRTTGRAVVLLAGAVVIAASCSEPAPPVAAPDAELLARGRKVYETEACAACHGAGRRGSDVAPSLWNLRRHWDEDSLVAFLRDPVASPQRDARMAEVAARYAADMPAIPTSNAERIRALAHYLLHE